MNWHSGMVKCSKLRVEEADRRTKGLEASQDHVRKKRREKVGILRTKVACSSTSILEGLQTSSNI
jgi:hypothetical protein